MGPVKAFGSRSIRVAARDRFARLSGDMVEPYLARSREATRWDAQEKYRAAIQSALSAKVLRSVVVSELSIAEAKTKLLASALAKLGIVGNALFVVADQNSHVVQAGKNLSNVIVLRPEELNVYDVLRCHSLVIPQSELDRVKEVGHERRPTPGANSAIVDRKLLPCVSKEIPLVFLFIRMRIKSKFGRPLKPC